MFKGSLTALITPFRDGEIDWPVFDELVERQIEKGCDGLVPCGTTGETPTLTQREYEGVISRCVDIAGGRVPVIAGTGTNCTEKTIGHTQFAKNAGADAALVVVPYYNKPTQDGIYAHFSAVHDGSSGFPIVLYDIPGRSGVGMTIDTIVKLTKLKNIVGLKDATGDLARPALLRGLVPDDFSLLTGEDGTTFAFLAQGGDGAISVTANLTPNLCASQHDAWQKGELQHMAKLRERLAPVHKAMFFETSPAPVKYAMSRLGLCREDVRLPLVSASPACRAAVDDALQKARLL